MYKITGILRNGKRFKAIYTKTPQCYNIWNGTIWWVVSEAGQKEKCKKVRSIYN